MAVFAPMPSAVTKTATSVKPGFLSSIRTPYLMSCHSVLIILLLQSLGLSFVSKRHHRVHLSRAPRGDVAGDERHARQEERDADEGRGVERAQVNQRGREQARDRRAARDAEDKADGCQPQALSKKHADAIARPRA